MKNSQWKSNFCFCQFLKLMLPGTLTYTTFILQQISDTIIGGRFLGQTAIAGISIISPLIAIGVFISGLLPKGTSILFNIKKGEFNEKDTYRVFSNSLITCFFLSLLEIIVFNTFFDAYLNIFKPSQELAFYAREYFKWYKYAVCLFPFFDLIDNLVYSDGDTILSSLSNSVIAGLNIALSIILARKTGVMGIGLASFISYIAGLLLLFSHFFKKTNSIKFQWYFSAKLLGNTIIRSMPHDSEYLFKALLQTFLNTFVMLRFGENGVVVLSAVVILMNLEGLFSGVCEAIYPIVGVYYGEKNGSGVRKIMKIATKTSLIEGILFVIIVFATASIIPSFIGIEDKSLLAVCRQAILIVSLGAIAESLVRLYVAYYSVTLRNSLSILANLLNRLVCPCLLGILFSSLFGLTGMWIALASAGEVSIIIILTVIITKYRTNNILLIPNYFNNVRIFDCILSDEAIILLQKQVSDMIGEQYNCLTKNRMLLVIEEVSLLIRNSDKKKNIIAEFDIVLDAVPKMIIRYNGDPFDLTEDVMPQSLNEYVFSCVQKSFLNDRYLLTAGYNRLEFVFDK